MNMEYLVDKFYENEVIWDAKTYLKGTATLLTKTPANQPQWGISKDTDMQIGFITTCLLLMVGG